MEEFGEAHESFTSKEVQKKKNHCLCKRKKSVKKESSSL